jgi:hypothetical protein
MTELLEVLAFSFISTIVLLWFIIEAPQDD